MRKLFSIKGRGIIQAWEEERIIRMFDEENKNWMYFDYEGNNVIYPDHPVVWCEDDIGINDPSYYKDLSEDYYAYTTHEVEENVDDTFGLFGIKDKYGNVIVEEKYWEIGLFSNGLCPVREVNGDWGCVNEKGDLVLPCVYWDMPIFNKYGIAYGNASLIDMKGNEIEDTPFNVLEYPMENDRYYTLVFLNEKQEEQTDRTGSAEGVTESIYDTKNREYVIRDIPECRIHYYGFDGEPCVIKAASELLDEYETVKVEGKGIIIGEKASSSVIYDYYGE